MIMGFFSGIKYINRQRNLKTKKIKIQLKLMYMRILYRDKKTQIGSCDKVCLFMHTQAIGDVIITSGLINNLKKEGKKVFIIAPERLRFLFDKVIPIDGFYAFNKKKSKDLSSSLKKLDVDLVIDTFDFDHSVMYRLNTLFQLKPRYAISFDQPDNTIFDLNIKSKDDTHFSERMGQVLNALGMGVSNYRYHLRFDREDFKIAHDYASDIKKSKKLIIFNPFGSQEIRSLSIKQINDILVYLNTLKEYKVIVFNMGASISCNSFDNIELNPFSNAGESFALASNADMIITVDTAIVHLASAFGIKQYCIYNNRIHNLKQDNNIFFGPNSQNARQLTTSEHVNTEEGDNMHNFDIALLTTLIDADLNSK